MNAKAIAALAAAALLPGAGISLAQTIDLPTSKQLIEPVPGQPKRLNSMPVTMAVSPDHRYVVTVNDGYGTFESNYEQSLVVYDTQTGSLADFPDERTRPRGGKQTLYSGLAFSTDGRHIYASMGSTSDPTGERQGDTGNGIVVYSFEAGKIAPDRFIRLPLQQLAPGRFTRLIGERDGDKGIPYPAAIVDFGSPEKLLVAGNLSDDVFIVDTASGSIEKTFDLSESNAVPGTFPIALAVTSDATRAFVALWNASEVVELDLAHGTVARKLELLKPSNPVAPGTHPCALKIAPDGKTLYVALSNRDAVAAISIGAGAFRVKGYFDTRLPGQSYFGAEPVALALSDDGSHLYVANAASDAVAVIHTARLTAQSASHGMVEPAGFVPTEWLPFSMAFTGGKLYVATAKGKGTGPNNMPQREVPGAPPSRRPSPSTYIASLLYGSLAVLDPAEIDSKLSQFTAAVLESNRMKAAAEKIPFAGKAKNPIHHVIYIIKENRTYDQILGDLSSGGKQVGNGDSSLTMYGESITPNLHKLALQFGVLDNFFDSGEVSGDGHVWSNAAIGSDYLEEAWQIAYRNSERPYDFEGAVANGYPLEQKIPDVNQPASGYLWTNLAAHHKTYFHFGEYISTVFCTDVSAHPPANPQQGPLMPSQSCARKSIAPGEAIPEEWGGGVNKFQWAIPLISSNTPTKPELMGHFAPEAPDFQLLFPDQLRVEIFLRHLAGWVKDMKQGRDTMPEFIQLRLPNDHTAGTRPGSPTPKSSVADNDLAVGRAVEAISHSPFWDSTAFFILEDDAQNGADHVDAHRSIGLVVSKYSPHGPYVDSRFYSTVSMVRTMETLLGLPPMNNNDAFSSMISPLFTGPGDEPPYTADTSNRDNGLIYTANKATAPGAHESSKMDFRHADRADAQKLNVILWKDAMGAKPVPPMLKIPVAKSRKTDDDD